MEDETTNKDLIMMGFSSNTDGRHSPYDKNVKLLS